MSNSLAHIAVCLNEPLGRIAPEIYSHFAEHLGSCVNEGIWVGTDSKIPHTGGIRNDIVAALRRLRIPVLRWPGGCFADDYHWEDGTGPGKDRPRTVNLHWGQNVEDNQFGTHEFIQLCRLIGAAPYLAGNVGSGAVRELRHWMEYCNFAGDSSLAKRRAGNGSPEPFKVRYWGVGNENWGCGGNFCPEDYAAEYKRYATYCREFGGTFPYLIACGPDGNNKDWTERFFKKLGSYRHIHGFAAHYYVNNRDGRYGTAMEFSTGQFYGLLSEALGMEDLIVQQRALLDQFDPQRMIGLLVDEWGAWHPADPGRNPAHLFQQNTMRDALVAALTLNIFNRHPDKVVMANIAQVANVLQAMVLTDGDRMLTTPTFSVFEMYQTHQGGQSVRVEAEGGMISFANGENKQQLPRVSASASILAGVMTLSIVNADAMLPLDVEIDLRGGSVIHADVSTLAGEDLHAHNTFEEPDRVTPTQTKIGTEHPWRIELPPASVSVFKVSLR
ncbi:MAG: alpha-N-arabinofuranosidase [Planctomycetota bacterium]|nr:alpha-N-arabinofuranosidase [Planctomycetota bacterium]